MNRNITRTALITGASRGLGLALARALAQQGWQLILTARGQKDLQAAYEALITLTNVVAIAGDVADLTHQVDLANAASEFGGLDALINNAGMLGPSPQPSLLEYPLATLLEVLRINVVAPLGVLQAVTPHLKEGAAIINITSDAAVEAYEGWGGYGASKAALEQVTAVFAVENPQYRVYWVDPGDMRTAMHQAAFPGEDISDRPLPEVAVPSLLFLLNGSLANGRYQAQNFVAEVA